MARCQLAVVGHDNCAPKNLHPVRWLGIEIILVLDNFAYRKPENANLMTGRYSRVRRANRLCWSRARNERIRTLGMLYRGCLVCHGGRRRVAHRRNATGGRTPTSGSVIGLLAPMTRN